MGEILNGIRNLFSVRQVKVVSGIKTKGDGARAAEKLKHALHGSGYSEHDAKRLARHELAHQRRERGVAEMGILKNFRGQPVGAYLESDNIDPDNLISSAVAPDVGKTAKLTDMRMSKEDVYVVRDALREKREKSRNQLKILAGKKK